MKYHGFYFAPRDFEDHWTRLLSFGAMLTIAGILAWQAFNAVAWRMTAGLFILFGLQ